MYSAGHTLHSAARAHPTRGASARTHEREEAVRTLPFACARKHAIYSIKFHVLPTRDVQYQDPHFLQHGYGDCLDVGLILCARTRPRVVSP